jgi:hypothetical protein
MTNTNWLEGTPDQLAQELYRLPSAKRYRIVEVDNTSGSGEETKETTTGPQNEVANVEALISEWQRQDNTPAGSPPPNDGTMTPSEALFRKWEAEDATLTTKQIEEEIRFWEAYQRDHERVSI